MSSGASTRWQRRDLPWRPTLRGVVVAGPDAIVELTGPSAALWTLLEAPASRVELAAAFASRAATDAMDQLEALEAGDPLDPLRRHGLIRDIP